MLAFGAAFTVIAVPADVEAQPLALVINTEYEPGVEAVMDAVVAPFDHTYEAPELAVNTTFPP
jgi:hypothetical protein